MNQYYNFLFAVFPYMAVIVFIVGSVYRYRTSPFQVSSLSSQFLEGKSLFWGSVPFHIGILFLFFGHLAAFLFPKSVLAWNNQPWRLLILEASALIFALSFLIGLFHLFIRRVTHPRLNVVTNKMDILIEVLLFVQGIFGCWVALGFRWGSSWFASTLSPYLWSLVQLNPKVDAVSAMNWVIQVHIFGAFLILLLFPFTRLVHMLVAPLHYLARSYQRVIWYWDRKSIRNPLTAWCVKRPKNN
ncbi:MAG: respiratory nitrate reductase subunit gamma [Omnitrophica WOR_2 bacterium GWA2_45_18]|nr:MAG: respiratory nitrate reductase subunit gamma [Omnitrophica WOR_2 bacterium GWA2_45_18]